MSEVLVIYKKYDYYLVVIKLLLPLNFTIKYIAFKIGEFDFVNKLIKFWLNIFKQN